MRRTTGLLVVGILSFILVASAREGNRNAIAEGTRRNKGTTQ